MYFIRYLFIALLFPVSAHASGPDHSLLLHNFHFRAFDVPGLSGETVVHAVHRDSKGRLWIGTETGLYLFNGNELRRFEQAPGRSEIPNYFAKSIAEGPDGRIWIGTWGGGLVYYDEKLRRMQAPAMRNVDPDATRSFDGKIWSLAVDPQGRVWMGTFTSGLFLLDPSSGQLRAMFQPGASSSPAAWRIDSLMLDPRGRIWFSPVNDGIHGFDASGTEIKALPSLHDLPNGKAPRVQDIAAYPDGRLVVAGRLEVEMRSAAGELLRRIALPLSNIDNAVMEALPYNDHLALVGTASRLWFVNFESGEVFPLPSGKHPGVIESSISWDMDIAGNGDFLVGGTRGVWISTASSRQFWTLAETQGDENAFLEKTRAFLVDNGKLVVNSASLVFTADFDGALDTPRKLPLATLNNKAIGFPLRIAATSGGYWLSTDNNVYHAQPGEPFMLETSLPSGGHAILFDRMFDRVLFHRQAGLVALNPFNGEQTTGPRDPDSVDAHGAHPAAVHLSYGSHDDIWAGTFSGLFRYERATLKPLETFVPGFSSSEWNDPLVSFVNRLASGETVIGTGSGIYLAELDASGRITQLSRPLADSPFAHVGVIGSFDDGNGNILLLTDEGFLRWNPQTGAAGALLYDDNLPNPRAYMAGFYQAGPDLAITSGELGPLLFNPSTLSFASDDPALTVSDIMSFRGNDTEYWPLREGQQFEYQDKVIRFRFGLLDYLTPGNNKYELRLRGFSDDWIDLGQLNEFSFTNLDPGGYDLEIRARNGLLPVKGITRTHFDVLPPWWRTWWAYSIYVLVIVGSLVGYWLQLQHKIRRAQEINRKLREADRIKSHFLNELETRVEEATQDLRHAVEALEIKNVELDAAQHRAVDASRLKSEFLANMSHEIRTPMNGVLGFVQLLHKSRLDNNQRDYVETIEQSARSLLGVINDVLDVSKIEAGKLVIDKAGFELRQCIAETLEALAPVAYEKNLELTGHVDADLPEGLRSDATRLRQMLTNLAGNAIKFTDSGSVCVHVSATGKNGERRLHIRVSDTGRGISADDRERLFQAFERGSVDLGGRYTGTGLGLVITKKLCEAMGGRIDLESAAGHGTTVTLELPLEADRNPERRYGFGKPLEGRKLVVIDPDAQSREALRTRFEHWGARVDALADVVTPILADVDLLVIGIPRNHLGDAKRIKALFEALPATVPRLCLASTVDHEALGALGAHCGSPCIAKVGHLSSQLRRIRELLGEARESSMQDAPASAKLGGLHILVADDNRINRWFLRRMLELHGAKVSECDSGERALQIARDDDELDLVLLDVHMPDIDGLEVARRLRASGLGRLPLLAVSANVQPETHEAAIAAGINDYLLKPVEEDRLVEAVLEWTGREARVD